MRGINKEAGGVVGIVLLSIAAAELRKAEASLGRALMHADLIGDTWASASLVKERRLLPKLQDLKNYAHALNLDLEACLLYLTKQSAKRSVLVRSSKRSSGSERLRSLLEDLLRSKAFHDQADELMRKKAKPSRVKHKRRAYHNSEADHAEMALGCGL